MFFVKIPNLGDEAQKFFKKPLKKRLEIWRAFVIHLKTKCKERFDTIPCFDTIFSKSSLKSVTSFDSSQILKFSDGKYVNEPFRHVKSYLDAQKYQKRQINNYGVSEKAL